MNIKNICTQTIKLVIAFIPFILFGIIYDSMRYFPNYKFGEIDVVDIYNLEKMLFGITVDGNTMIPSEYFQLTHTWILDLLSGIFYLCWVPLPIFYGFWLFFTHQRELCIRFTSAFLFVNLIGFSIYYIHPACPPWYVMEYGTEVDMATPGNIAGFINFDNIMDSVFGFRVFCHIYSKNSNVFAAMPSLHAAYVPIALYYATKVKNNAVWITILSIVTVGIWFSAVYSWHHYIIDVLAGVLCVAIGLTAFEALQKTQTIKKLYTKLDSLIK